LRQPEATATSLNSMPKRLIISDNPEDPGNPLVLDGEAIDAAAKDPAAIGKVMVDQVWAEGSDPTGGRCTTSGAPTATGACSPSRRATRTS
jgi:hypothetical protein